MKTLLRAGIVCALCAWLTGCAVTGPQSTNAMATPAQAGAVTIGKSTKADVMAALGKTTVVSFDSGFEVWVYQIKDEPPVAGKTEFVVLFAPSGVVAKTRIRPAPPGEGGRS